MSHKKTNYKLHREKLLKDPTVKKIYDEEMANFFAQEIEKTIVEAKSQLNATHKRLKSFMKEAA